MSRFQRNIDRAWFSAVIASRTNTTVARQKMSLEKSRDLLLNISDADIYIEKTHSRPGSNPCRPIGPEIRTRWQQTRRRDQI